jgi:hypothetical protein
MKLIDLFERVNTLIHGRNDPSVTMYFGCCFGEAQQLEKSGFHPSAMDGFKPLIVVSTPEMAMSMAQERGCKAIVKISKINISSLSPVSINVTNFESMLDVAKRVQRGEEISLKLVKPINSGQFEFVNKLRRRN